MIFEQDNKYYRQCDDCGEIVEIQKQFFRRLSKNHNIGAAAVVKRVPVIIATDSSHGITD